MTLSDTSWDVLNKVPQSGSDALNTGLFSLKWDVSLPPLQDRKLRVISSKSEDEVFSRTLVLSHPFLYVRSSMFFSWIFFVFAGVLVYKPTLCTAEPCGSLGASACVGLHRIPWVPMQSMSFYLSPWQREGKHVMQPPTFPWAWRPLQCSSISVSLLQVSFPLFSPSPILSLCPVIIYYINRGFYYFVINIRKDFTFPASSLKGWWENSITALSQKRQIQVFLCWWVLTGSNAHPLLSAQGGPLPGNSVLITFTPKRPAFLRREKEASKRSCDLQRLWGPFSWSWSLPVFKKALSPRAPPCSLFPSPLWETLWFGLSDLLGPFSPKHFYTLTFKSSHTALTGLTHSWALPKQTYQAPSEDTF